MQLTDYIGNKCEKVNDIWFISSNNKFSYSDGLATEEYIANAITRSKDLSSGSRELEQYIIDWPTRYHLGRERSLAYWPLIEMENDAVLEVGAGCGAITRHFAERAQYVLAVEGSQRRIRIARLRTRDLSNVDVL